MSDRCEYELGYLKGLKAKFGSHYLNKYFGFSLTEIAVKIGMTKQSFSKVITGSILLPAKHEEALKTAFKEMQIVEKTKDFKESDWQLSMKESWQKIKNSLTIILFMLIITSMRDNTLFLKPAKSYFPQYIVGLCNNLAQKIHIGLSVAVTFFVTSTLIFLSKIAYFFNNLRISFFEDVRFCL